MIKFNVTGTISVGKDKREVVQYHKEDVTFFELIKMLIKFLLKKEVGFYIERVIQLNEEK